MHKPLSGQIACYTSFSFSYLSRARILAQTLRIAHPDWSIWALITDQAPDGWNEAGSLKDFDYVMNSANLGFPRYLSWMFKHDVVEACTAVKGRMMMRLLQLGADKVIYFDPDIGVFNPIDDIVYKLNDFSIILTPHQIEPNVTPMAVQDNEIAALKYGVFNLGFAAIANDAVGWDFAAWWDAQLFRACYDDVPGGIFTDQKYCDLVPALFDRVHVDRDPGCNVASWNLSRREIKFSGDSDGQVYVNGSKLKFYHFTKFGGVGLDMTERYGGDNVEVYELWHWYRRMMQKTQVDGIPDRYWRYGRFSNGVPISKQLRQLYRSRPDLMAFFDDPFGHSGNGLFDWAVREEPALVVI